MAAKKKKTTAKKATTRRRTTTKPKAEAPEGLTDDQFVVKHFTDAEALIRRLRDGEAKTRLVDRLGDVAQKFAKLPKGKRTNERRRRYIEEASKISADAARARA